MAVLLPYRANAQSGDSCSADLSSGENQFFFYLSALTVRTLYFAHSCTKHGPLFLPSGSGARETTSLLACMTTPPTRFIAQCKHASYPNVKEDLMQWTNQSAVVLWGDFRFFGSSNLSIVIIVIVPRPRFAIKLTLSQTLFSSADSSPLATFCRTSNICAHFN